MKIEDLIETLRTLPTETKQRLLTVLSEDNASLQVRDASQVYGGVQQSEQKDMKLITLLLPDELASQAQAAGLLRGNVLETLLRKALKEQATTPPESRSGKRRLLHRNGRLVIESLSAEQAVTSAEVYDALHKMDW
jgi:hypothetical protein